MTRLFEFRDGKSDKFWEVTVSGKTHTVRYGRVGTDGQSKTKAFADSGAAEADAEKLISQKVKKGYAEVTDKSSSRSEKAAAGKQALAEHAPFLEKIYDEPDDFEGYAVYSDWLAERGDPRGELIQLQWQLEDGAVKGADRQKAKRREAALLKQHQSDWLDDLAPEITEMWTPHEQGLAPDKPYQFSFARGFLDSITIETLFPEFASKLVKSSHAKMLRSISIDENPCGESLVDEFEIYEEKDWGYDDYPGFKTLLAGKYPNLRVLKIDGIYPSNVPGIERLLKKTPRLEELHLNAHSVDARVFSAKLPHLRTLLIDSSHDYPLEVIAKNSSFANLETLSFEPHALEPDQEEAYIKDGLRELCRSKHLKSLKHIHFQSSDFGDDGIREIVESGLIHRLETLSLPHGATTNAGVDILLETDLSNLKSLVLTGNYITATHVKKLKEKKVNLKANDLRSVNSMDERSHLWEGDWE